MTPARHRRDRGSAAVEAVIVIPAIIVVAALALVGGRTSNSRGDLNAAARYAAREISLARDPATAVADAEANAHVTLQVGEATCRSMQFTPTITAVEVTVEITCVVDLAAATMLPVPGHVSLTETASEPVDRWREVQ